MEVSETKPAQTVPISLQQIRYQLIDSLWIGAFIMALIGAPSSALRSLSTGWLTIYTIHIYIALFVTFIFIFRKKIPYFFKSFILIAIFLIIGILGLFTFGVLGAGIWWIIMSCFLISTLYSLRAGIWTVGFTTVLIIIAGYCFTHGILSIPVDANVYVVTASSWVTLLIVTTLMPIVVLLALASFQHATVSLLKQVDQQKSQIQSMGTHDQLTGLLLLNQANEQLQLDIENAKLSGNKVALFFIDLDGFKAVNDTYGHDAGDYVIKEVALRMLKHTHDNDTACRNGGDEFILIFPEIADVENVKIKAQKIIDEISKPYQYSNNTIHIGASIGISLFNDHAKDAKLLRILADEAMYSVKTSGKNGFALVPS